jgi:hypothetical protein
LIIDSLPLFCFSFVSGAVDLAYLLFALALAVLASLFVSIVFRPLQRSQLLEFLHDPNSGIFAGEWQAFYCSPSQDSFCSSFLVSLPSAFGILSGRRSCSACHRTHDNAKGMPLLQN